MSNLNWILWVVSEKDYVFNYVLHVERNNTSFHTYLIYNYVSKRTCSGWRDSGCWWHGHLKILKEEVKHFVDKIKLLFMLCLTCSVKIHLYHHQSCSLSKSMFKNSNFGFYSVKVFTQIICMVDWITWKINLVLLIL